MGSLGYQTGTSEPPPDEHGPATCPEWLMTKQAGHEAAVWRPRNFTPCAENGGSIPTNGGAVSRRVREEASSDAPFGPFFW